MFKHLYSIIVVYKRPNLTTMTNLTRFSAFVLVSTYLMGCEGDVAIDCLVDGPIATATATEANCGSEDGSISITIGGGIEPFEYTLDQTTQSTGEFTGLIAGSYMVTITDGNGCETTVEAIVNEVTTIVLSAEAIADAGCLTADGQIEVEATGGAGFIEFAIDGGASQTTPFFTDLASGSHTIQAIDDNGCSVFVEVDVASGVSFEDQVRPLINANCTLANCHNGSNSSLPNFSTFGPVQSRAADIKSRTQSGNMPATGSLTADEKAIIACWVDDGALDN